MKWKNLPSETRLLHQRSHNRLAAAVPRSRLAEYCWSISTSTATSMAVRYWRWKEQARALGITSVRTLKTKINYIHENPVRRQLVSSPLDWPWSSWRSYEKGDDSVLRVDREALASAI